MNFSINASKVCLIIIQSCYFFIMEYICSRCLICFVFHSHDLNILCAQKVIDSLKVHTHACTHAHTHTHTHTRAHTNLSTSTLISSLWIQSPHVGCLLSPPRGVHAIWAQTFHTDDVSLPRIQASLLISYMYSTIISIIIFVWVKMAGSINPELTVDVFKQCTVSELCQSGAMPEILGRLMSSVWNFFGLNHRHFSRRTQKEPKVWPPTVNYRWYRELYGKNYDHANVLANFKAMLVTCLVTQGWWWWDSFSRMKSLVKFLRHPTDLIFLITNNKLWKLECSSNSPSHWWQRTSKSVRCLRRVLAC